MSSQHSVGSRFAVSLLLLVLGSTAAGVAIAANTGKTAAVAKPDVAHSTLTAKAPAASTAGTAAKPASTAKRGLVAKDGAMSGAESYFTVTPCRALDTRQSTALQAGTELVVQISGSCGVPADARSVMLIASVVEPKNSGFIKLYSSDAATIPTTSTINFANAQTRSNNTIVELAAAGGSVPAGSIKALLSTVPGGGHADLVLDVHGYYADSAPVANPDSYSTLMDTVLTVPAATGVLSNDTGPALVVTTQTNAATTQGGTVTVNADGSFTYTPATGFVSPPSDTFDYTITNTAGTATATVTISVTDVNDPPTFTKGADQTVLEDAGPQTVTAWATAISPGPASESGQTVHFNVTGNTNAALFSVAPAISPTGDLTYTPAANANGTAAITITLQDNGGTANGGVDTSAAQTFNINVTAVNDAPSFTKGADQSILENAGAQTVPSWATAISAGPPDESGQTLTFNVTGNTNAALFSAGPSVSSTGTLTYTPATNASGTATITLTLQDNGGTANGGVDTSAPQTFVINVGLVNQPPSFTKGPDVTVLEDAPAQSINPWATAISPGPANESGQTVHFNVTGDTNAALFSAAPAVSSTGVLTFTPAANANGTAAITITLQDDGGTANGGVDTSAAQTFNINVTAVNDVPSFTKGPDQSILENAGAQTVPNWATAISAGPPDESGQTLTFMVTGNTNAALFSAGPAISSTGTLTYTPATNASGTATITVVLKDSGGTANGGVDTSAAQTFVIDVALVNQAPSFTKGPDVTVLEDSGVKTVNPWATAVSAGPPNESGQTLTFLVTGDTNAALFSAGPAISSTGVLTFTPAANANGTAAITIVLKDNGGTANGGVDTSASQTFNINVTAVNDAPSFTKGPDVTVLENAPAQTINPWATAISAGPANESGQTVHFNVTGNTNAALFSTAPAVSATGVLTFTPATNNFGTATITITLQDDGGTANGGVDTSAAQTFVITVNNVNQAPSFTKGADQTVLENSTAQTVNPWATAISAGPASESGQTVHFNITGNTNAALFSAGPAVSSTGVLTYTPATGASGSATITLTLQDNGGTANGGVDTSAPQTFTITVTPVNQAPSFTKGPDVNILEDAGPQTINPWATAISAGPGEGTQTVHFNITGDTNAALFSAGPTISATGVLTFTPVANANGTATITITLQDDGGTANGGVDTSAPQTFNINVTAVNDAPSFVKGADQSVNDNAGAQTVSPWATSISAGPANESGQTVNFIILSNSNPGIFTAGPAISSTGVLTYTPAVVPAGTSTATIMVEIHDNGGTANGGVDTSAPQSFTISITHVNLAPQLIASPKETFDTVGNVQLEFKASQALPVSIFVSGNLVSNFTDSDGPSPLSAVAVNGGATTNGGTVTIATDGTFTYTPKPGDAAASDSFSYQITDGMATVTRTVTVNLKSRVWFVKNNAASGGTGGSQSPFNTLAAAQTASVAGDYIFVYGGSLTNTGQAAGITLKANQKLYGEAYGLPISNTINGVVNPTLVAATVGNRPVLDNTAAGGDGVTIGNGITGTEVRGFSLSGTQHAINLTTTAANNNAGVMITDNLIRQPGIDGIHVAAGSSGTGTVTVAIANNTITGNTRAVSLQKTAGLLYVTSLANNAITGTTPGTGFDINGAIFDAVPGGGFDIVSGGTTAIGASGTPVGANGMLLANVTGDLAFTDLDIYNSAGTGLLVSSTGAVNLGAGTGFRFGVSSGVSTIDSNGGPAVSVNNATFNLPSMAFLRSTNSTTTGVSLVNAFGGVGGTTLSASTGQVADPVGASGIAFDVNGGNGSVSFGGPIINNSGNSVVVTNRTSDTVSFSGAITETGSGISLTTNTGATISFTGTLNLSTGANTAFNATGGGTVTTTDTSSTATTTTGTAINVANTTIGAAGLKFKSVTANGGSNGIVLDTTGASGSLTVLGNGSAGSGGTIRNMVGGDGATAGSGIFLNKTNNVSLSWLQLNDFQNFAIRGTSVSGFTLSNSVINGTNGNNASGPFNEGSVSFSELTGSVAVSNTSISGGISDNFRVVNTTGSLNRITFTSVTVGANSTANGNDGITLEAQSTATLNATIQNSTFTSARGDLFQLNLLGTSTSDLVFSGNTLSNNHPAIATGGGGVTISGGDNSGTGSTLTYNISNNTFRDANGHAVLIVKSTDPGSFSGTFSGNTIGVAGVNDSGSVAGDGLKLQNAGLGTVSATITGNQIRQYNNFGIELETGGGATAQSGALNTTITGNTISNPGTGGLPMNGIQLNAGTVPGDTYQVCSKVGGAGGLANSITGSGANGGTDFRLRQRQSTTVRLPGYGGANNDNTAVVTFLQGLNGGASGLASNTVGTGGGGFVGGGTTCP
jgi:VCBS repeat-containing protein